MVRAAAHSGGGTGRTGAVRSAFKTSFSKGTRKFRGKELDLDAEIIEESRRCAREDAGLILSRAVDPARLGGPVRDAGQLLIDMMLTRIPQVARRRAGPSQACTSSLSTACKASWGVNPWLSCEPHKARRTQLSAAGWEPIHYYDIPYEFSNDHSYDQNIKSLMCSEVVRFWS